MTINYAPKGICATNITVDVEDGIVKDVHYAGGCPGNHTGIARLVKGMKASDVIEKLEGIRCGNRLTSCPGQLAEALKTISIGHP